MAATVRAYAFTSTGPTATSVDSLDSASFRFGRDDLVTSASSASTPIPTTTGTHFSWRKTLGLYCTAGGGATSLLNRGVKMSGALTSGISLWQSAVTTYVQAVTTQGTAAGNTPADSGSNGATPANQADVTWVAMTTSNVTYDASTQSTVNTTVNGKYLALVMGVDNTFALGGGPATMPSVIFQYDEQASCDEFALDAIAPDPFSRVTKRRASRLPMTMQRGALLGL